MNLLAKLWRAITAPSDPGRPKPQVIVHDPAAHKPRDLDDPFLDPKLQQRMGEAIARVTEHKVSEHKVAEHKATEKK